ncbi:MAG: ArsC/Spx/MgsR family protein, partial [Nevskiales bacterium]
MSYTVYGLKNCDSCRKAMRWLADQGMDVQLHDLRQDGLSDRMLKAWLDGIGAEALVNRRSTTWRELDEDMRQKTLGPGAETVLLAHPT